MYRITIFSDLFTDVQMKVYKHTEKKKKKKKKKPQFLQSVKINTCIPSINLLRVAPPAQLEVTSLDRYSDLASQVLIEFGSNNQQCTRILVQDSNVCSKYRKVLLM